MDTKIINNGKFLAKDLIQGDEAVANRADFQNLNLPQLQRALNILTNNPNITTKTRDYLLLNSWKLHYKTKPPTMKEFLTYEWLGPTANNLYPKVVKVLTEYWDPISPYRNLILASGIGTGKSFTSTISNLFIIQAIHNMRDPKKFFNLNQAASILLAFISFTQGKAAQTLLQPIIQIISSSPKFKRINREDKIKEIGEENPDQIVWTTAGRMGAIQFDGDIHIMLASSPSDLLGLNMISATMSEISFFIDKGFSPEYIWRIYQDSLGRIYSRFGNRYYATTILDSSPNDIDASPIDKYIFEGKAYENPLNYIVTGTQWDYIPWKYPEWLRTKETFPVFKGGNGSPCKIIPKHEVAHFKKEDVYDVPIDIKQKFIDNPVKSVKDYCGWPSGVPDKLISDYSLIEKMFVPQLRNIYTHIFAPADLPPEGLIWEAIKKEFFIEYSEGKYEFYRAPRAQRFLHFDQSESGDITGIGSCHKELSEKGDDRFIIDFTIPIVPGKKRINLEAIYEFLIDLRFRGGFNIKMVTFDQYQSSNTIQKLKRMDFAVDRLSVDSSMNPYLVFVSHLNNGRVKCGRNIYFKNNLKSIKETKTEKGKKKIDHLQGKVEDSGTIGWDESYLGYYAKDISDAVVGAVWNCINHFTGIPKYSWKDMELVVPDKEDIETIASTKMNHLVIDSIKQQALDKIRQKYGLN